MERNQEQDTPRSWTSAAPFVGGEKQSITLPLLHFQLPGMQQTPASEPRAAQQFNLIKPPLLPVATQTLKFASASAALARLSVSLPSFHERLAAYLLAPCCSTLCLNHILFESFGNRSGPFFRSHLQATLGPGFHCTAVAADTSHPSLQPSLLL